MHYQEMNLKLPVTNSSLDDQSARQFYWSC